MGPKDEDNKRKMGTWGESTQALTEVKMWFRDNCASGTGRREMARRGG